MTINISFSDTTVRVAVEINGAIESAITELPKRPWVGLTDEEIDKKYWAMPRINKPQPTQLEFARAIEQMLKEKNA